MSWVASTRRGGASDCHSEGRRPLGLRFHVIVSDPSETALREKTRSAVSALDRVGMEMVVEDALAMTLFLQALPFQYDPAGDRGMKSSRPV